MKKILELGYLEWSRLSFIEEDDAHTLERLVEVTHVTEESVVEGLENLKQKGLINIEYENGKVKHVDLSEKGWDFYSSYM